MSKLKEYRFELPDSDFQRMAQALREHLVGIVNDRGRPPSFVQISLPHHLVPPTADDEIYEESLPDGRFVEVKREQTLPLPVQQVESLLQELRTRHLPEGPVCRISHRSTTLSKAIEVVLSWN